MTRQYDSAQHAVDAYARLTAAVQSVGAVGYEPDDHLEQSHHSDGDPGRLIDARADLTAVFDEAQRRADKIPWMHWCERRALGHPLELMVADVSDTDLGPQTLLKAHIREVDDIVETALDERGMLATDYSRRAADAAPVEA